MLGVRLFALVLCSGAALAGETASVSDQFTKDIFQWKTWSPCQINMKKSPIKIIEDQQQSGNTFVRIIADDTSLEGNKCRPGEHTFPPTSPAAEIKALSDDDEGDSLEDLGPSLILPRTVKAFNNASTENPYCTSQVKRRALAAGEEDRCIQRQELRFQKRSADNKQHRHPITERMKYSFRFRVPKYDRNKKEVVRWVITQWKHTWSKTKYCTEQGINCDKFGPSPYLAQRFDGGVFHITVQDEHCRCVVASAPNPYDPITSWDNGKPARCAANYEDIVPPRCEATSLRVEYGAKPELTSPVGRWTTMTFNMRAGGRLPSEIEVYQDGRFIVRVTGAIGYDPGRPTAETRTKFKLGMYRAYMPYTHALDFDWLKMNPIQ